MGDVLAEAWSLFTRHSVRLIVVGAIVFGVISLVQAAIDATGERGLIPISIGVTIVGTFWLQGALVAVVEDLRDGKADLSIADVFRQVEPRLWVLIGAGILAGIAVLAGLFLLIVPGLVLITFWSLIAPAIVLERKGILAAFSRSQQLVSGHFLPMFGVILVTVVLAAIIAVMIAAILSPLPDFVDVYVAGVIGNSITMPFVAVAWTLAFYDLRALKG
jgi:hypothetical protein